MDNGTVALILSPLAVVITAVITQWVTRRNAKDQTEVAQGQSEVDRFEAILEGQDRRIRTLEDEVEELKNERSELKAERARDRADLSRLRDIVRAWFDTLRIAWADHPTPMPMPAADDLEFLGLTVPRPPRAQPKER